MVYEIILGREEKDRLLFGTEGTVLLGKHYVNMGSVTALSQPVYLDLNKSHVVFICGKRGSGKCLTGDTLITLSNGRQVPIREIEYTSEQVLALNHELKIQPQGHTDFYKRIVDHLLAIKLRSGKVIKLTPEHPLLTLEGWKPAKELAINSRIATPRLINAFGNAPLSEAEVKILAYMIAEGHTKAPLFFTNSDPEIVQDLSSALKTFYSVLELTPLGKYGYKVNSRNEKRTVISHHSVRDNKGRFTQGSWIKTEKRIMRQFLETHGVYGLLSSEKEIPSGILQAPKQKIALFLNRIFSCDGSIYFSKSWQISYSTSSLKLAQGVHHLLLRFGILSKIRTTEQFLPDGRPYTAREIVICGENVIRFFNEIGFFGRKEKKQAIALIQSANLLRNPNNDTIPQEIWKFYKPQSWAEPGRHWGYVHPKAARESVDYAPSRQKLLSIAEFEQSERLKLLATSDIFWDEIEKVEHLYGEFDVYDITVPNLHNFIANDIIVHNSYALGAIAEGITQLPEEYRKKLSVIMFDTMGIYWTMKYPNHRDELLLKEWGLEGKGVPINIYVPFGHFDKWKEDGIPVDKPFALNPSELAPDDWNLVFEISTNDPIAVFIERVILELRETRTNYSIGSILAAIDRDGQEDPFVRQAAKNRFSVAQTWGLFSSDATPVKDLAESGQVAVLDLSAYSLMPNGWRIKHL
ncbi:MAG TPA: LAGLIDADG family homing endonuclease, partial [Candidatus Nanoarchaeia archaeon]|nr:LAGLIDADG family homing endonuclease [Candidatus Nanoarchaeia archaeon]